MSAATVVDNAITTGLVVHGLDVHYGDHAALSHVDVVVSQASCVAVLGANGAGKSTLLNTIAGLVRPTAGSISLGPDRIDVLPAHRIAAKGVCYIPEGRGVFPDLTVLENLRLSVGGDKALRDRYLELLPAIAKLARRPAGTLSGGEQQMLAVAPALVGTYDLLMVDELSLGLGPMIVDQLYELLVTTRRAGTSMVVVEQFADRALGIADTAYVLRKGEVVFEGPASHLASNPDELHALYLGGLNR